jgi:hypothetical protein
VGDEITDAGAMFPVAVEENTRIVAAAVLDVLDMKMFPPESTAMGIQAPSSEISVAAPVIDRMGVEFAVDPGANT